MEKNTNINMSSESSAHNDINQITLKKKVLDGVPEEVSKNTNSESVNSNQGNNTNNKNDVYGNNKDDFKPKDSNYHSGILERTEVKKDRKPSVLIIFIIIVAVFLGEIIYNAITNKKSNPDEIPVTDNNTNEPVQQNDESNNQEEINDNLEEETSENE